MHDAMFIPRVANPVDRLSSAHLNPTDAKLVAEFSSELERALFQLKAAADEKAKVNQGLAGLKNELDQRGLWGALGSTFSGKTDKDLAHLIEGLGKSLDLTQSVVRVILTVATQKNSVLHSFNAALVDKITAIQVDTRTLNSNQKNVALHFLGELREQIQEQLRHHALVDSHEVQLDTIDQWQREKDTQDAAMTRSVAALTQDGEQTRDALVSLVSRIDEIEQKRHEWQQKKNFLDTTLAGSMDALSTELGQARDAISTLTSHVALLERERYQARSIGGLLIRSLPALVALATAVAAVVVALH